MPNRLAHESSPYLLQHQDNPVEWYPWGEEALHAARTQNKPILLSIGYSACHWCHVMAHESFENPRIAALMNNLFINIKVDREERPDLDAIYMDAVTAMTGHGGWPMTVFLTPEGVPFYGGTYFPPVPRHGMASFPQILEAVAQGYARQPEAMAKQGQSLLTHIAQRSQLAARDIEFSTALLDVAFQQLAQAFDGEWGGFGRQGPKFPQPMVLEFVLRYAARNEDPRARRLLHTTLSRMARGGIYDQLGGGFARYSVDGKWMIPHFEKMLYDNGQLITLYLHAWQLLKLPLFRRVAEESLAYLEREMIDPAGGFFSAQDADSEGVEGKFFAWTVAEIDELLTTEEARIVKAYYGVHSTGNFEGKNVLWIAHEPSLVAANLNLSEARMSDLLATARAKLFAARAERIPPATDSKVLVSWNALAIRAFALASRVLDETRYVAVAARAARFILDEMRRDDGRLHRTWKAQPGRPMLNGYLEDYAYLIDALITLYEATFEVVWLREAQSLAEIMIAEFGDEKGGFFDTGESHEALVVRPKGVVDNAMPSGNSMAATALLRLSDYLAEPRYAELAQRAMTVVGEGMAAQPQGFGQWLVAVDALLHPSVEVALVGDDAALRPFIRTIYDRFLPHKTLVASAADQIDALASFMPSLQQRRMIDDQPTAYLCENYACQRPVTTADALAEQLTATQSN